MERRALIAVAISLFILIVYQELILKRFYPPQPGPEAPQAGAPPEEAPLREPRAGQTEPKPGGVEPQPSLRPVVGGRDVVVETDLYRAVFTTAGARLKSLELKRYRSTVAPDSPPLDLVLHASAEDLPLGVELRGQQRVSDREVIYDVDRDNVQVASGESAALTFNGRLDGTLVTKRIEVRGDQYLFDLHVDAADVPARYTEMGIAWNEGHGGVPKPGSEVLFDSVVALQGTKLKKSAFKDLDAGLTQENDIEWVGYSGRYFFAAIVPEAPESNDLRVWMKRRAAANPADSADQWIETQLLLPPGKFSTALDVYVGPKDMNTLEAAGHSLRRAVDLGWFTFVALPMLQVLRLSHHVTRNYGLDIILLTVVVKLLFFPLTQKSFKSMREMQKLQPQMAKIRERYKDKPDEMNREIMELYRRHKVNPLSGCLPMVFQMPVFVGLYQALLNAVELRHAPFIGWIHDLSAPDRLGTLAIPHVEPAGFPVMTLLMGISMFVQQWMTPAQGDPTQQRMMMIMPLIFTFMFINFPAGLTLYWLVNNVLTIAQQYTLSRSGGRT
jgi:YidC/Oxa1 family membrane protein insertase